MKKPSGKRKARSDHYGVKALFDHSAQYPTAGFEAEQTGASEIGIDHLATYIDRITKARSDGYWSVLREEL
jgi:hypothetical protein